LHLILRDRAGDVEGMAKVINDVWKHRKQYPPGEPLNYRAASAVSRWLKGE